MGDHLFKIMLNIVKAGNLHTSCRRTNPTQLFRLFSTSADASTSESKDSEENKSAEWEPKTESELRDALLKASFVHAKEVGFNDQAIVEACKDFGYPSVSSSIIKRGPIEIVDHAMEFWLQQMREELTGIQDELQ